MYSGKEGAFVLKMVKWHRQKKNNGNRKKRIASAVCMLGVLVVCLGVVGYRNKLKADEKLPVMTRGVVDQIEQIPESKRNIYDANAAAAKLGTKENPFLVLEIVPFEEYAEFGYQIAGCEPANIEEMRFDYYGNEFYNLGAYGTFSQTSGYFFRDELPGNTEHYEKNLSSDASVDGKEFIGYYERVEDRKGNFVQKQDGSIVKNEQGNIIWHTVNDFEKNTDEFKNQTFSDDLSKIILSSPGQKIYTVRKNTTDDPIVKVGTYFNYKSNDNFLTKTLGLTKKEAENYSILVKTITPKELNANPEWADYADFYTVTPSSHNGVFVKIWEETNRLEHRTASNEDHQKYSRFENDNMNDDRDITWKVALKMYNKITADKNYAAMMMEATTYGSTLKHGISIQREIMDWNLRLTGKKDEQHQAYNSNMYKLAVMLFSMKPELFKRLYLDEKNPLIKDGKFLLQEEDAQDYWTMFTFLPSGSPDGEKIDGSWYAYWTKPEQWKDYQIPGNIENRRGYINASNRFYVYNSGNTTTSDYVTGGQSSPNISEEGINYDEFKKWLQEVKYPGEDISKITLTPSDAVEFILGYDGGSEEEFDGELRILDLEPCYNSKNAEEKNSEGIEREKGYYLQKSFVYLMLPRYKGTVKIDHMTTAEFIGSSVDLNAAYDMIFMGLDDGAYNVVKQTVNLDGDKVTGLFTKYNDYKLNGKIYLHTGDKMMSAERSVWGENRSVKFLYPAQNSVTLRFPGNDITKLKKVELENFLDAGHFIVAVSYLYQTDKIRIDQSSNICKFIQDQRKNKRPIFSSEDREAIYQKLKEKKSSVTFTEKPQKYDGTTSVGTDGKITIANPNYLQRDDKGRPIIKFAFDLEDPENHGYKCKVYIDQNQDGKFDDSEVFYDAKKTYHSGKNQSVKTIYLSKYFIGIVNWKIEVYQAGHPSIRFVESGCSVADNKENIQTSIRILQIMPSNSGGLNLTSGDGEKTDPLNNSNEKNKLFTQYYEELETDYNYKIHVTTITLDDFQKKFSSDDPFTYDYSQPISESNPDKMSDDYKMLYNSYDMMIIGFGDMYGGKDLTNLNGSVDFIKYFIARGKSVLFTHDLTSMNNVQPYQFGYSANMLLRDVMGMNRYGAISNQLMKDNDLSEINKIKKYQENITYDTVTDVEGKQLYETHGFTYYTMKRLGWPNNIKIGADSSKYINGDVNPYGKDDLQIMPYRYMIESSAKEGTYVYSKDGTEKLTGFNNLNDITTKAEKVNDGQITEYPYKISDDLDISPTHGQYYQLNMEDPEVTVWYCLKDDRKNFSGSGDNNGNGDGTAATYGVSPKDAANNYYIYSKENVFYSGVGHSQINGDMEAKLFINTMIAAYRASNRAPMVEVLNEDAKLLKWDMVNSKADYDMASVDEYDGINTSQTRKVNTENEGKKDSDDDIKISFSPVEVNTSNSGLKCSIYYGDEKHFVKYIYHVTEDDDGNEVIEELQANDSGVFEKNINNMDEYYFYYPKAYRSTWKNQSDVEQSAQPVITFKIQNKKNKEDEYGITSLDLSSQYLFLLD